MGKQAIPMTILNSHVKLLEGILFLVGNDSVLLVWCNSSPVDKVHPSKSCSLNCEPLLCWFARMSFEVAWHPSSLGVPMLWWWDREVSRSKATTGACQHKGQDWFPWGCRSIRWYYTCCLSFPAQRARSITGDVAGWFLHVADGELRLFQPVLHGSRWPHTPKDFMATERRFTCENQHVPSRVVSNIINQMIGVSPVWSGCKWF